MNTSTEVTLKTLADISKENVRFYIDAFQRGYRWTESEVKDLLDDIHEFSQSDYKAHGNDTSDRFYCLQPIIITKAQDDSWKVIDGQQRLTTLYLIYLFYNSIASAFEVSKMPFEIHYNGKEKLEKCLAEIQIGRYFDSGKLNEIRSKYENDIDCCFILNAYAEICDYFIFLQRNMVTQGHISEMKNVFNGFVKIIWYELVDCDEQEEISMFTKINMGKIPLTNAELIKALLLRSEDDKKTPDQDNIAIKWDEMEAQLSDSVFWSFLVNNSANYSTRIDFIFEIMAREINDNILRNNLMMNGVSGEKEKYYIEQAYNRQYFSFYVFNNYVRYLKKNDPEKNYVKEIWTSITEFYEMFRDWFHNRKWYHMIGYIVEVSGENYIDTITELSKLYKSQDTEQQIVGHKTMFEQSLRELIKKSINISGDLTKKNLNEYIEDLEYDKSSRDEIRRVLLLFNISSLELLEKQTDARFPFDKYKDKRGSWDIEHINAVADDRPNDAYDRADGSNACLLWLQNVKAAPYVADILMPDNSTNVVELIDKVINEKLYLPQNEPGTATFNSIYDRIIEFFSENGDTNNNSIGNLTLLDSVTNRSYKNDIFPLKRETIIDNCSKDIYIPLCTKEVFLKAYKKSNDLLRWTSEDMQYYINSLEERISEYLRLEDAV